MSRDPANATVELGPLSDFLKNDRYLLTLQSLSSSIPTERQVVLFRLARQGIDHFYAIESECPHAGGPMKDSELEYGNQETGDIEDIHDDIVAVCPWHGFDFNLVTGESSTGFRACTWRVQVEQESKQVIMEGPENSGDWHVLSIEPVSEAFVEPDIPFQLNLQPPETLTDWACLILNTPDPDQKVALTREAVKQMRSGAFAYPEGIIGKQKPPDRPPRLPLASDARPAKMGKGAASTKSQLVYLHNVAHIEQWAIDLAWDLIARFSRPLPGEEAMPLSFFEDWATIAEEEAKHFTLLRSRLEAKGSFYGAYKTQDGLWDSASSTSHSILSRLSIVCLVHEARGLDVNPAQITRFRSIGDEDTAQAMTVVHCDEVSHVAAGHRYLTYVCEKMGLDPVRVFRDNVKTHFAGRLKGPFNAADRAKAGMKEEWYASDWE